MLGSSTGLLERQLAPGSPRPRPRATRLLRIGLVLAIVLGLGALTSQLNLERDLHRLNARLLSGVPEGNYHVLADALVRSATRQRGRLQELPSQGSSDNIARLRAARASCEIEFALAQDGSDGARGWKK